MTIVFWHKPRGWERRRIGGRKGEIWKKWGSSWNLVWKGGRYSQGLEKTELASKEERGQPRKGL